MVKAYKNTGIIPTIRHVTDKQELDDTDLHVFPIFQIIHCAVENVDYIVNVDYSAKEYTRL